MKKVCFLFLIACTFMYGFTSCTPGERNKASSSSETAMADTLEIQHSHGDSVHTHSHAHDGDTLLHSH